MTASIKERNTLCDREDYVEDQEIKLENKSKEQLNQLKETRKAKEKRRNPSPRKMRLKRTKTVSYLTGTQLMDKAGNDNERAGQSRSKKELSRRRLQAEGDATRELNAGEILISPTDATT